MAEGTETLLKANGARYKILTLAFIMKDDQVLLGLKKRGFGSGLWNGFGGKVASEESICRAAVREIEEESGLTVQPEDMEQIAVIDYESLTDPVILKTHVFRCSKFRGEVTESEEMRPKWYPINKVPHYEMWNDAEIWYPLLFKGTRFNAYFLSEGYTKILSYKITNMDNNEVLLEKLQ